MVNSSTRLPVALLLLFTSISGCEENTVDNGTELMNPGGSAGNVAGGGSTANAGSAGTTSSSASGGTENSSVGGSGGVAGSGGTVGSGGTAGSAGSQAVTCARPDGMPAVTLTYDDALNTQLTTAAPALKAHELRATFFVTDVRANQAPWSALLADGHELGSHTFKHPCPASNSWVQPGNANEDYDLARMATELDDTLAMLQALGQPPPYTFAYPCGVDWVGAAHDSYVPLIQERFAAARGVAPGAVQAGVNLFNVPTTFSTSDGAALIAIAEQAKAQGTWVVYGFHGIGGDTNAIAAEAHEELLTYLDDQRDAIYVATFGELAACFGEIVDTKRRD